MPIARRDLDPFVSPGHDRYNRYGRNRPNFVQARAPTPGTLPIDIVRSGDRRSRSPESNEPCLSPEETREEFIARLKRAQAPIASSDRLRDQALLSFAREVPVPDEPTTPRPNSATDKTDTTAVDPAVSALAIERPKSALHAGNFRNKSALAQALEHQRETGWSPPASNHRNEHLPTKSWLHTPSHPRPDYFPSQQPAQPLPVETKAPSSARPRALSSTFVLRTPTSPLAQQSTQAESENSDESPRGRSRSPAKNYRRRTFSPHSVKTLQPCSTSPVQGFKDFSRSVNELQCQKRPSNPRHSLSYIPSPTQSSIPWSSTSRHRRFPSYSDASPLQHAPMVGGYEESILRGRMSTIPSRALDFVAQIGVLGRGNCKSSLRCPSHVSIPFPAVFYNYGSAPEQSSSNEEGPSPYVGLVDLENMAERSGTPDTQGSTPSSCPWMGGGSLEMTHVPRSPDVTGSPQDPRERANRSRRAPKGGYRIPEKGQIQVVIKNPNKTAVKLFLVPYDLSGMQPGQKTFIRQRSYSAGPILDMPIDVRKNLGTDRPEAAISHSEDPRDRPVLRYLIHLHICCTSQGRFYLYKSLRVVFANRVPDNKEKLRTEVQLPEPRFSIYKPEGALSKPRLSAPTAFNGMGAWPYGQDMRWQGPR